jgi:hypothetical protein
VLVFLCGEAGASERLIAYVFDLSRSRVRKILTRGYYRFVECAQARRGGENLSPIRAFFSTVRCRAKGGPLSRRV